MKDMCGYHRDCLLCEMMPNRFVHVLWQHGCALRESGCQTGLSPVQTCPPLKIFGTLWYKHITKGGPNCWAAEFVKVRRDATQWEGDTTRLRSFYTSALQNIQFNAGFKWFSNHFVFICISHSRSTFFLESVLYTQLLQHRLHLKHGKTQRAATTLDLFKQKKWTGRAVACYALWMVVSASCPRNIGGWWTGLKEWCSLLLCHTDIGVQYNPVFELTFTLK